MRPQWLGAYAATRTAVLTLAHFGVKAHRRSAVAPARMRGNCSSLSPRRATYWRANLFRSEEQRRRTVSHLRAVTHFQTTSHRIGIFPGGQILRLVGKPPAGLRLRVTAGVGEIDLSDSYEVPRLSDRAFFIFVAKPTKELGKRKFDAFGLLLVPGCGARGNRRRSQDQLSSFAQRQSPEQHRSDQLRSQLTPS